MGVGTDSPAKRTWVGYRRGHIQERDVRQNVCRTLVKCLRRLLGNFRRDVSKAKRNVLFFFPLGKTECVASHPAWREVPILNSGDCDLTVGNRNRYDCSQPGTVKCWSLFGPETSGGWIRYWGFCSCIPLCNPRRGGVWFVKLVLFYHRARGRIGCHWSRADRKLINNAYPIFRLDVDKGWRPAVGIWSQLHQCSLKDRKQWRFYYLCLQ